MSENLALISNEEKGRAKYFLGYLNQENVLSIGLGVPMATQPLFLVEGALNRIPESAVGTFRRLLAALEKLECQLLEASEYLVATKLGEMELAGDYQLRLQNMQSMWAKKLADFLGVPLNPYSENANGGRVPINSRVVGA